MSQPRPGPVSSQLLINRGMHRKKRFRSFPSPAGMSLTKLPLGRNNSVMTSLFPPWESLVVVVWGRETREPFFTVCCDADSIELWRTLTSLHRTLTALQCTPHPNFPFQLSECLFVELIRPEPCRTHYLPLSTPHPSLYFLFVSDFFFL